MTQPRAQFPAELEARVAAIIGELRTLPWLKHVGISHASAMTAADLPEAHDGYWDGWNQQSASFWTAQSYALEAIARGVFGDTQIGHIFERATTELGPVVWEALGDYLEQHRDDVGVADAIAIDVHQSIIRDASWILIETVLARPGVFGDALAWYRKGTRLFGWVGGLPPNGRAMIL